MKYIIKNCPLYEQYDCFNLGKCKNSSCCNGIHIDFCKDIENCLLKQIVEKCIKNNTIHLYKDNDGIFTERGELVKEILNLLEIEEVE